MKIKCCGEPCTVFKQSNTNKKGVVRIIIGSLSPFVEIEVPENWNTMLDTGFNAGGLHFERSN